MIAPPAEAVEAAQRGVTRTQRDRIGISLAAVQVARALTESAATDGLARRCIVAMAAHPYDLDSSIGLMFGGAVGQRWARSVLAEEAREAVLASPPPPKPVDLVRLSSALAKIDASFRAKVESALSQAMRAADRKARRKAGVRANKVSRTKMASIDADWSAGRITPSVLAAISTTDDELFDESFDDVVDQVGDLYTERQTKRAKVLAAAFKGKGLTPGQVLGRWEISDAQRRAALAAFLGSGLFLEARARLQQGATTPGQLYGPEGEIPFDTSIPAPVLNGVLMLSNGAPLGTDNSVEIPGESLGAAHPLDVFGDDQLDEVIGDYGYDIEGDSLDYEDQPPEGVAGGPFTMEAVALGGALASKIGKSYIWRCGEPARPFPPHQELDGATFGPDEYFDVCGKSPADFPYQKTAYFVGDHPGCQCSIEVVYGFDLHEVVDEVRETVTDKVVEASGSDESQGESSVTAGIDATLAQINALRASIDPGDVADPDFESKHPRGHHGQFVSKGDDVAAAVEATPVSDQIAKLYGGGYEALFPPGSSPVQTTPWGRAGRSKARADYDQSLVQQALRSDAPVTEVDPRTLKATQPSVTAPGVKFYLDNRYSATGELYADQGSAANRVPVIYSRFEHWPPEPGDTPTNLILSGHHRATAALLAGEPLEAVHVAGPWGSPRKA